MKKSKLIGILLAFGALVASSITFSGRFDKKVANVDEIPEDQLHFELAGITTAHTYSNDPTQEPKYKGTVNFYNQNDPNSTSYSFAGKDTPFGRMNVANTWNSYRGESVKVAVIDTGCYYSHEEFANTNFVSCKNIYSNTTGLSNVNDGHGHGTTSAAMIAASINNAGSVGIAPNVDLVILKCSNDSGAFSNSAVLDALQYCIDNEVDVVNMSIQGYSSSFSSTWVEDFGNLSTTQTSTGIMSSSYCESKINDCYEAGITVVAAAGNYNTSTPSYPAANDHVIAVASTGLTEANKLNKAGYSNYGSWIDICAPGYVYTPTIGSTTGYTVNYGTSFSAPLVTGAIALYKSKYPYAKPDQIEKALKETATAVNWQGGAGAINVGAFLNYVPVEEISVSEDNVSVQMGSSYTLQPSVLPQGAIQTVTYESSDESVCTVNSSGVITPVSTGEAVIQITSSDYEEISKLVYVEVVSGTTSVYKTVNFTSSTMGSVSSYTSSFTVTDDGVTATVNNGNNNANSWDYVKFGPKNKTSTGLITNTTSIDKKITQIDLSFSQVSYVTSAKLYVSSSSSFTNATEIAFTPQAGTTSINISSPIANGYYKIEIAINNTSGTNGVVWLTKIEYYADSGTAPTPVTNYTVTFNANDGSGTMANQTTTGSTYTTPSCGFNRSGYTFSNWALNGTGGTQYAVGETISNISANITLYAIWTQNSGSTFSDDYGNYYDGIGSQLAGSVLTNALHSLNATKKTRSFDYGGLRDKFQLADLDWTDTSYLVGFYDNAHLQKAWDSGITWNREHVWPDSRGGDLVEGDLHMVRPTSTSINSGRGNKFYGSSGSTYDPGQYETGYRGVAARIIFYSAIANTGLTLVDADDDSQSNNTMGRLSTLLQWNLDYQPNKSSTAAQSLRVEQYRNKAIYSNSSLQGNRNPFIDHPEYACRIWGATNSTTKQICGITGSLSVSQSTKSLAADDTFTLTATASGGSGNVYWDSSDNSVCTISTTSGNSVVVTGISQGTATITAMYGSLTATCTVTVTGSSSTPAVNSVSVSPKTMTLNISSGSASGTITPTVDVSGGAARTVDWNVSPENQGVTVSNGTVTAAANATTGTYTVTATSTVDNTKSDFCTVTVTSSGGGGQTSLSLVTDISSLGNGDKVYIATGLTSSDNGITGWNNSKDATVSTTQSSWKEYTVEISNGTVKLKDGSSYIAAVSENAFKYDSSGGAITLDEDNHVKVGSRWISKNGSNYRCYTSLGTYTPFYLYLITSSTPTPTLSSISLNTDNVTKSFSVGDPFTYSGLVVTGHYSDSSSSTISSGYTVSTPDMSSAGTKTITVSYGEKDATYTITVSNVNVTGVSLNKSTTSLAVGSTETLTATITPNNATNKNVTWTSSVMSVATVTNGTITAVAIGTTVITVRTADGGYTDTCTVTITAAPTITYQLEADSDEVPFNSGTNHIASVGVKLYQYNNGVKGSVVSSGSVNVDTSSLGRKTVQFAYSETTYTTTVKVTNHGSLPNNDEGEENLETSTTTTSLGVNSEQKKSLSSTKTGVTALHISLVASVTGNTNTTYTHGVTFKLYDSSNTLVATSSQINVSTKPNGSVTWETDFVISEAIEVSKASYTLTNRQSGSNLRQRSFDISYEIVDSAFAGQQALAWAVYFINETRTLETCLAESDSQKLAGLHAKWADLAYEYTEMIGDSKDEFCTSNDATIVEARNHYLYIVSKFGASNLGTAGAFVKNSQNQVLSAKANNPLVFLKGNSSIPIIVIMSVISITSIGLYFYLRKRKEE